MTGAEYYAREGWDGISVTYGHDYGLCCHLMAPVLPSSSAKNRWRGLPGELLRRDLAIRGWGVTKLRFVQLAMLAKI